MVSRRTDPIETAAEVPDTAPAAVELLEQAQEHARLATCLGELEERHATRNTSSLGIGSFRSHNDGAVEFKRRRTRRQNDRR